MIIDSITIILSAVLLIWTIVSALSDPLFRNKFLKTQDEDKDGQLPPLSLIIPTHDNALELERHLPMLLAQDYPDYQIIIVADKGDSETEDVLKRYGSNPRIYSTFIPNSSRYMSRTKLAITLGVKAARNEWILLTDIYGEPVGNDWLKAIGRCCDKSKNLVMTYSNYAKETKPYYRFEQAMTACRLMRKAATGTAYSTNSPVVGFRKSEFMRTNGYQGNLELIKGEYDFLVNKFARPGDTALAIAPEAKFVMDDPSRKTWRNRHIFYMETRKHLKHGRSYRCLFNWDQIALHSHVLLCIAALAYSIISQRWIVTAVAGVVLLLAYLLRFRSGRTTMRLLHESFPAWKIPFYEVSVVWHQMINIIRYIRADKYDFTSHKL